MPTPNRKLTRIGVFYDGSFFLHVSNYYCFNHPRKRRINLTGLQDFIRHKVAEEEEVNPKHCVVAETHYFRGRPSTREVQGHQALISERAFDEVLIHQGIATHYLPLTAQGEKGIDVWLALEAYDLIVRNGFDVCVLIAGDGDFLPLVRKVQVSGSRMMVLGWDFNFEDEYGRSQETRTSHLLREAATYGLRMEQVIGDQTKHDDAFVNGLFMPDLEEEIATETGVPARPVAARPPAARLAVAAPSPVSADGSPAGNTGSIFSLKEGYGFIRPEQGGDTIYFFHRDLIGNEFAELNVGDWVSYEDSSNHRGPCAVSIRVTSPGSDEVVDRLS